MNQTTRISIDFEPWAQLLQRYVSSKGLVDYQRWSADNSALAESPQGGLTQLKTWLTSLQTTNLESLDADTRLAFLLNLYNALTIRQVLEKYPLDSIRPTVFGVPNWLAFKLFFSNSLYELNGQKLSLDDIEHNLIRKKFAEPRIHFALVCASSGCPQLRNEAYWPATVREQLERDAQQFIRNPEKVRYDAQTNVLYCSKIFKWYEEDFLTVANSVADYIQRYSHQQILLSAQIEHLPYSWQLNDKRLHP